MTQSPAGQSLQPGGPDRDYPPTAAPAKRGNGYAVAGVVLALPIWPLGLPFSIIGLAKSRARARSGMVLSIIGIVLSLIVAGPTIAFAVGFLTTV